MGRDLELRIRRFHTEDVVDFAEPRTLAIGADLAAGRQQNEAGAGALGNALQLCDRRVEFLRAALISASLPKMRPRMAAFFLTLPIRSLSSLVRSMVAQAWQARHISTATGRRR